MSRAAEQAHAAADALQAWLDRQTPAPQRDVSAADPGGAFPHAPLPNAIVADALAQTVASGDRPVAEMAVPVHTDWLYHRLTIRGPQATLAAFRSRAAGAGIIPWRLDFDRLQEDWFHRLMQPSAGQRLDAAGARILAGQLRAAAERRQQLALSQVGRSRAGGFDLQALLPVPDDILALGPEHPHATAWLWQHWGTTQALRHVAPERLPQKRRKPAAGQGAWHLTFWSADWTPWRALAQLAETWPALQFDTKPIYDASQ